MKRWFIWFIALVLLASGGMAQTSQCGSEQTPCVTASGTYHVLLPQMAEPTGIVMHLHGAGGRGRSVLTSSIAKGAVERGYVFVAPDGYHPGSQFERNWSVRARNSTFKRDDMVFLAEVMADVRLRFGVKSNPVLLSGFSRGGSMVWDVACHNPAFATAYAPLAGAFWDDLPAGCAAPVRLFHTHGWTDRTVPLEGRSFGDGAVVQGDVWASLKILRETNGCGARQPETNSFDGENWFRHWTDCDAGQIDLMLHKGGHGAPKGWVARVLDWFEG